jgi:tetratricopeptide (TPR) repeat protein
VFFCLATDPLWAISQSGEAVGKQAQVGKFFLFFLCAVPLVAQDTPQSGQDLNAQFQAALAAYHAGQFAEAATRLEKMLPKTPSSFEVHELLGLVYASESQYEKAVEPLQTAAHLQPNSAAAHINLAAALSEVGNPNAAADQLHKAIAVEPHNFDGNHNLGVIYVRAGKVTAAVPFLEEAQRVNPSSYENGYDLALAYSLTGRSADSEQLIKTLLPQKNTGELHDLLAQVEEKRGNYVAAADEFSVAAHMDPSEGNLFDWGSELLLHRTYDPAIAVFGQAVQRYPGSPRLWTGLGMAQSSQGKYEEAIQSLLKAADLNPSDARCYRFLAHAYELSPNPSDEVVHSFRRYAELAPRDSMAQYYYAAGLLKGKTPAPASPEFDQAESLLRKSVDLDPNNTQAHFRLGNLYADQHDYEKSFPEYQRTVQLDPDMPDAHYRLGQYYVHAGKKDLAQQEFATYQQMRAKYLARLDKENADVKQFVTSSKPAPATKP